MAFQTPLRGTASAEAVRRGGACVFWSSLAGLKLGVGVGVGVMHWKLREPSAGWQVCSLLSGAFPGA